MTHFPPVRDKEVVKVDFENSLEEYRSRPNDDNKDTLMRKVRRYRDEYFTEVLDTYETETRAVRLTKFGERYFVSVWEKIGAATLQGSLFFGGTESEEHARTAYDEEVNDIKTA